MSDLQIPVTPKGMKLQLNTVANSRKSFARIIRMMAAGELDGNLFRALVYGMTGYLSYIKTEQENEIIERLDKLEANQSGKY